MADYITRINTTKGPLQIDYTALANLPDVSSVELGYMKGVTSPVQGQIEGLEGQLNSTRDASNITSGTLSSERLSVVPVSKGGTGATDAATAINNLGAAQASHRHNTADLIGGTIAVAMGGTGATDAPTALQNLGAAPSEHTHDASNIDAGTLAEDRLPTISVAKGGTGAATAEGAREALGITAENIGALSAAGGSMTGNLVMNGGYIVLKRGVNYGTESEIPADLPDGGLFLKVVE